MPAHEGSAVGRVGIGACADAKLIEIDEQHPLRNGFVQTIDNAGRYIATDWVTRTSRTMGIELSTFVAINDV